MKRIDLIHYLLNKNCTLAREGAKHSIFINIAKRKVSTVPRHNEIEKFLARKICKDLDIEEIK